jgi:hypothetical protein
VEADLTVQLGFILRVGVVDDLGDVGQGGHNLLDLLAGEAVGRRVGVMAKLQVGLGLLCLGFGDPLRDDRWVGAGVEGGSVAGDLAVVVGEELGFVGRVGGGVRLAVGELVDGVLNVGGREEGGEPVVDGGEDFGFADVGDVGAGESVCEVVLVGVAASVVIWLWLKLPCMRRVHRPQNSSPLS